MERPLNLESEDLVLDLALQTPPWVTSDKSLAQLLLSSSLP